jgi:hypothetical protein
MTDIRKAAEMALEALDCLPWQASPIAVEATKALRQALAEGVKQEIKLYDDGVKLKREWKGLTSDDKHFLLANAWNKEQAFNGFMEAIDKFLEEKNT